LPELTIATVRRVFSPATVGKSPRSGIRQPARIIPLAHYQQPTIRTELRASKFQPHRTVAIHPITAL
jgi:hypothetical protein